MTKDHLNLSTDNAQDSLFSIDDCNEAYQYLQNSANFVSFHTGLTTLMQRCGYTGSSEDVEEKTAYLQQKLAAIHVKITEITVRDWFSGKRRPSLDSRSRKLVYEICFALGASFELVQEFFRQVYFSRSFNCHTIKEAVYYYCLHQKPFLRSCSRALQKPSKPCRKRQNSKLPIPSTPIRSEMLSTTAAAVRRISRLLSQK